MKNQKSNVSRENLIDVKQPNNFIAFRVDRNLADVIEQAVFYSGVSKTDWMIEAIVAKLGMDTPDARLNAAIDRLEAFAKRLNP